MPEGTKPLRTISNEDVNRLFAEATKQAAFEARMRGIDVMGLDENGKLIVVHPDGTTSPFYSPAR